MPIRVKILPSTTESHGCKPVDESVLLKMPSEIPKSHGRKLVVLGLLFLICVIILLPSNYVTAVSDIPAILPRSEWTENKPSLDKLLTWIPDKNRTSPPDYRPVERIVLHYTDTPNTENTKEISIARIQSIFYFHSVSRKWGDIGYNYIIDRLGNIYEGRYGGNGVRGAHAANEITGDNYNVGSIGIALLGNYANEAPPEAMFLSLQKLVGWLSVVNGFEPSGAVTSKIWNGKNGDFTTLLNTPRVMSHKDIDKTTGDSAIPEKKFTELRTGSQSYYDEYKNYLYQAQGQNVIYEIINGEKRLVFGNDGRAAVSISLSQLDLFPLLTVIKYPNHTLIKTNNSGIALIENNYRRPIINPEIFLSRFKWSDVVTVSQNVWASYTESAPLALRDGMLVRAGNSGDIYVISKEEKKWISGPALFENLGYKWDNIEVVSPQSLAASLAGAPIVDSSIHPDGTLVTSAGKGVALLEDGKRRPIPTPDIFQINYKWKDIVSIPLDEWNSYEEDKAVYYPNGMLLREVNNHKVYLVENGNKRWITSPVLFDNMGYKWENIVVVLEGSSGGMALGSNISADNVGMTMKR